MVFLKQVDELQSDEEEIKIRSEEEDEFAITVKNIRKFFQLGHDQTHQTKD